MNYSLREPQSQSDFSRWHSNETGLASMTSDEAPPDRAVAVLSSRPAASRCLVYTGATVSIELSMKHGAVLGRLVPPQPGSLVVAREDSTTDIVQVDGLGCFALRPAPEAPFRLQLSGEVVVTTDWLRSQALRGDDAQPASPRAPDGDTTASGVTVDHLELAGREAAAVPSP